MPERQQIISERAKELTIILDQCFDVLKTYGKPPEALANMHRAFMFALDDYDPEQIRRGFVDHLRKSKEIPTPADIIEKIEATKPHRNPYPVDEIDLDYRAKAEATKARWKDNTWVGKEWESLTEKDKQSLFYHIGHLSETKGKERALGYCQYLKSYCKYPDLKDYITKG